MALGKFQQFLKSVKIIEECQVSSAFRPELYVKWDGEHKVCQAVNHLSRTLRSYFLCCLSDQEELLEKDEVLLFSCLLVQNSQL